jgi:hypothetical protein
MLVRPPEKRTASHVPSLSFFPKIANDNRPPQKSVTGWLFFWIGILFLIATLFLY